MPNYHSQLEEQVANRITDFISRPQLGAQYGLLYEPLLSEFNPQLQTRFRPDFLIMKGPYAFMIIEVVGRQRLNTGRAEAKLSEYLVYLELLQADFFILTDGERIHILNSPGVDDIRSFDSLFILFEQDLNQQEINKMRQQIVHTIRDIFLPIEGTEELPLELPRIKALLNQSLTTNDFAYDSNGRFFYFTERPEKGMDGFEHRFFQYLLDPVDDAHVCRYTTLSTVFYSIMGKSYRMASHLAMNDRGEIDYVDTYIDDAYTPLSNLSLSEVQQLNRSFISSLTNYDQKDDLTMYRLYAEDTKGVCLVFDLKNSSLPGSLILRKISYARKGGYHPELELLRRIVARLKALKIRFKFRKLDLWKHFFKSADYAIEKEIRMLYIEDDSLPSDKKGWVIASPDSIVSKYILFDLEAPEFPLRLTEVILAPNCPEKILNKQQFKVILDEKGFKAEVSISKIVSYRKT